MGGRKRAQAQVMRERRLRWGDVSLTALLAAQCLTTFVAIPSKIERLARCQAPHHHARSNSSPRFAGKPPRQC